MKKIFTFFFFAFALLIGTQSATAQNKAEVKQKAYLKAKEVRSIIKFNDATLEKVYDAYYAYELKLVSIEDEKQSGNNDVEEITIKAKETLQSGIKEALGEDLYKRYLMVTTNKK